MYITLHSKGENTTYTLCTSNNAIIICTVQHARYILLTTERNIICKNENAWATVTVQVRTTLSCTNHDRSLHNNNIGG